MTSEHDLALRSQVNTPTKQCASPLASLKLDDGMISSSSFESDESEYAQPSAAAAFTLEHNLALATYVVLGALFVLALSLCGCYGRHTGAKDFTMIGKTYTTWPGPSDNAKLTR